MLEEYRFGDIYIRHAIDDSPVDSEFTMHIHEQCEIYFFISGNVEYMVEGSKYPLEDNSLMIMRPSEVHKPRIIGSERYERYAINFPVSFASDLDPERRLVQAFLNRPLGINNCFDTSTIDTALIKSLCIQMFQSFSDDYARQLAVKSHILLILGMISRSFSMRKTDELKPRSQAEKIVAYVNNHIFEDISVPELAGHFFLSPSQFTRIFRSATGASPWEYIVKKRLTAAKEKIHSGSSAQSASESCGFKDYSSFYRAYTKYFGISPTTTLRS